MHRILPRFVLVMGLWVTGPWLVAQALLPDVQERRLDNGVRILLVERPGLESVRAQLFLMGGQADTGVLPSPAATLLARCLFSPPVAGEARKAQELESLLKWEEGIYESLRTEKLKRDRQPGLQEGPETRDLEMVHRQILDRFHGLGSEPDALEAMAAGRRESRVDADVIAYGADIPAGALGAWSDYIANRLRDPLLVRYPLERQRLLVPGDVAVEGARHALDVVLSTALSGQRYAQVAYWEPATVESLTWSAMREYARRAVAPDRIVVVLVGGVRMTDAFPLLQTSFGSLGQGRSNGQRPDDRSIASTTGAGSRRVQTSAPGKSRLIMGWRIPPRTHPDSQALLVLAKLLEGGELSQMAMDVRMHVPGGKDTNLLLVEGMNEGQQSLSALEQLVRGEIIRLQRGNFKDGEIRRAQRQVEVDQVMSQEDAATLADALGEAQCQGGDWRLAFRALQVKRDYPAQEIQGLALKYLVSEGSIVAMLEPDPILQPQDQVETETARVLTRILESRLENRGKVEAIVREALKQLRMLSLREREQTLRLLQSQVKP